METMSVERFQKEAKKSRKDTLENKFLAAFLLIRPDGVPAPERQYKAIAGRKFASDFAWPQVKLAVEIHGGSFRGGRHNTALGQSRDFEKHNLLCLAGWTVLYFNTEQLKDAHSCAVTVLEVMAAIGSRP